MQPHLSKYNGQLFQIHIPSYTAVDNLRHQELNGQDLPLPNLGELFPDYQFVRVFQLSRYWQKDQSETTLDRSMEDLVTSLHSRLLNWIFLLRGTANSIECLLGVRSERSSILTSLLNASFPGSKYEAASPIDRHWLNGLSSGFALTGIPNIALKPADSALPPATLPDRLDRLCRGLYGNNWAYVVYSEPLPQQSAIDNINTANDILHKISVNRSQSTYQEKQAISLLENKVKYLEAAAQNGLWATQTWLLSNNSVIAQTGAALLHNAFSSNSSLLEPIRTLQCNSNRTSSDLILEPVNSKHLAALTCLPSEEHFGYEVVDYVRFGAIGKPVVPSIEYIHIGAIVDRGIATNNNFQIPLNDLTKHGSIFGVTGSGKTNTCFNILEQIDRYQIPFLVIEGAKSEYRQLLNHPQFQSRLKIFTIGDETASPIRLNPFQVPPGILIQTHIDYLKSLFSAAFNFYGPMPYILERGIQEIYEECGWDLITNTNRYDANNPRAFPTLADLLERVKIITERMGYAGEILSNIKAALVARLEQLCHGGGKGPMFNTRQSVNFAELLQSPCIFELKQVVSDDEKAFFIGLILTNLYEYHEIRASRGEIAEGSPLNHLTLIEEAHRLLRNQSTVQSEDIANPQGRAIEVFTNMLAEVRAYGEGILIAEQLPVKLVSDAIKNTNLKIIHRLVSRDDRQVIGATLDLDETQERYLTRLEKGQAIAYAEGFQKAIRVTVPIANHKDSGQRVTSPQIKQTMDDRYWSKNGNLLLPFNHCNWCLNTSAKGRSCGAREASRAHRSLTNAFHKLFNTLRFTPTNFEGILDSYQNFAKLCRNHQSQRQQPTSPFCLFVELVNIDATARGRLGTWESHDVDALVNLTSTIAYRLEKESHQSIANWQELPQLAILLERLHSQSSATDSLPYAGCDRCDNPCYYRYDIELLNDGYSIYEEENKKHKPQQESDNNKNARQQFISSLSQIYSTEVTDLFPDDRTKGSALCLAIHDISRNIPNKSRQISVIDWVKDSLNSSSRN
jgi:DNA helicase HerA-like ATPase